MEIVAAAIEYIKEVFENVYGGHDFYHSLRVYKIATKLAGEEKADMLKVKLAAILHDVDDRKLSPETYEHKDRTVAFLKEHGVEENVIQDICEIIGEVSFAGTDSVAPKTIEGKCVQDADRLDAIGAIGIARAFAYGGYKGQAMHEPELMPDLNMSAEQYYSKKTTTINHFYEKLFTLESLMNTEAAKRVAKSRTQYMHDFVDKFLGEWEETDF